MSENKHICIIGAGLVGSLLSIYLRKRGYKVDVYERRPDLRKAGIRAGRSINLALSNRGIRALREVGIDQQIEELIIPMKGRMMHDHQGNISFQPYGKENQAINSISRGGLNCLLLNQAEEDGVKFHFEYRCHGVDFARTVAYLENNDGSFDMSADVIIGADGAYSSVRQSMQKTDRFNFSQSYISHGYKELSFPPSSTGDFVFDKNALHIWPRKQFMLIALPNLDKSFTVTLFLPFEGENSFAQLDSDDKVLAFFQKEFPDALQCMPDLINEYHENPEASLVTTSCYPWIKNHTALIGDAAHAIVPFYGQGMVAGFEDCYILNSLLNQYEDNWNEVLPAFQESRKQDADAIAELALDNFVVMRDKVADPEFLLRKKIESHLHELYPDKWIPLYSMVTFNENIRYSDALKAGKKQREIMRNAMSTLEPGQDWLELDFEAIVNQL